MFLTEDGIKQRVASGVVILSVRRILVQLIMTGSNIVLARMLAPETFGLFAIISFFILTLGTLTSFGLPQALIQKKNLSTKEELRAIFSVSLFSSFAFAFLIFFSAPVIERFYHGQLGSSGVFWLRLLSLNLPLVNMATISGVLLERKLDYKRLAVGELSCLFLAQILTVFFALRGLGLGSFILANLISNLIGLFIYFLLSPWPVGFNFSYFNLKKYLPFGLDFQTNTLIGIANGAVIPGFLGSLAGPQAVGLINWAGGIKQVGLAPSEVMGRLAFTACSRAQENHRLLKSLVERMVQVTCMFSLPLLAALFALARPITYIIYTANWLPGLTALYLSVIQGIFLLLGGILLNVLFALGQAKTVRNISLFWTILQWVLTIPLVLIWNFNGVVLAGILVSATFFIPLREVRKKVAVNIWPHVLPYLAYSILTGLVMFGLERLIVIDSLFRLVAIGMVGALAYWGIVFLFKRKEVINDFVKLKELVLRPE